MGDGSRAEKSASSSAADCDVVLGLKMQRTESFPCKRTMAMSHHPPSPSHHHHSHNHRFFSPPPPQSMSNTVCTVDVAAAGADDGGDACGGPNFCNTSNQKACSSGTYNIVGSVPRTYLHPLTAGSNMTAPPPPGKAPFTATQWQELERQRMIHKCMTASIPVPPELLSPIPNKTPSNLPTSQSNTSGFELKFSRSSDPEPWRCRRTDGKKWRCSRDVAPDQKYCERHAHKNRPRSRKPVESQPHNANASVITQSSISSNTQHSLLNLPANASAQPSPNPVFQFPAMVSSAAFGQGQQRCGEWFMKGDSIPVSSFGQQWQQLGLERENAPAFHVQRGEEQRRLRENSYMGTGCDGQRSQNWQPNDQYFSYLAPDLSGSLNVGRTLMTRHFIDAWSSAEKEDNFDEAGNRCSVSSSGKLPLSSLSLFHGDGIDEDRENTTAQLGSGTIDSDRENSGVGFKSQWLSPVSWMVSPPRPGGPLGEALCHGMAGTSEAASNLPSPHGYSNTSTTSSCSKSLCEDGGHGLQFH